MAVIHHEVRRIANREELSGQIGIGFLSFGVVACFLHLLQEVDKLVSNTDHFWITIRMGDLGPLRIALSTHSRQNAAAGFDPRLRLGVIATTWQGLPAAGLVDAPALDYAKIEADIPVKFDEHERPALEALLTEKTGRAIFVEAWGELYVRTHLRLHEVHSRRARCSVLSDYFGRDGAIRFYYPDDRSEMLLFKFCGQP